ncbi:Detected protein of confused Function [Hibiscus syriacus]|uniref:Detected protein of confused Function n=1 Tax=Hibiscus syriacus TaxID=106335 RepID=A0A6A3CRB2_HIBSY|nr:Detected protein of confused Function [Hibiscus syriacus]
MLCLDPKLDSHRFKDLLDEAIAARELKETKAYQKWAKKVSEIKPLTSPLRRKEKSAKQSESDLFVIISQRRNSEPSEEEFEAAQRKVESRKASN